MKTVFINVPGGETKIEKAIEIARVLFNQNELAWIDYDPELGVKGNVMKLLEADYYISIDSMWGIKNGGDRERISSIARNLMPDGIHMYYIPSQYLYVKEEWDEMLDDSIKCEAIRPTYIGE